MKATGIIRLICCLIALIMVIFAFSSCSINKNDMSNDSFLFDDNDEHNDVNNKFISDCQAGHENINGNTHANLTNGGIAAEQDGWIYFYTQPKNGNSRSGKLFKHKSDETDIIEIASFDRIISRLSVKGDYIYYLDAYEKLCKMRTDGTAIQEVFADENDSSNYMIVGDYIYVTMEEKYSSISSATYVVRYHIDNTSNCEKIYRLNEEESYYGVTGKYIIISKKSQSDGKMTLVVYNMDTKETSRHICEFENGYSYIIVQLTENAIFYTNNSYKELVKLDLYDMSATKVQNSNIVAQDIHFVNEKTIYLTLGTGRTVSNDNPYKLAKTSFDMFEAGKCYKILEEDATNINIVGDWIYYTANQPLTSYCRVKTDGTCWEMLYEYVY